MSNPAKYLHAFLSLPGEDQHAHSFPPLFAATVNMEEQLSVLANAGYDVEPFSDLTDSIRSALRTSARSDLAVINTAIGLGSFTKCTLEKSELKLLKLASDKLDVDSTFDEKRIKDLESLLTWVTEAVREDTSLDPHLALFITQTISAIKVELADFSITREFAVRDAVIRLFGLIRVAEGASAEPKKWADGWDRLGRPLTLGFIVSVPQLAISAGQLLLAISS